MLGAIIGDLIGSTYERENVRDKEFPLFTSYSHITDDSIMTLAVCQIIQNNNIYDREEIIDTFKEWAISYPDRGYGHLFGNWAMSDDRRPLNSKGNGAAMRISPVGWYAKSKEQAKEWSRKITEVTHNHPEAIKAAECVSLCIYYARRGKSKKYLQELIEEYYDIDFVYEDLRDENEFDATCEGSVPQALFCFLISNSFLDCLKTAISIGGDSDTIACIACSIAQAYYKHINPSIINKMYEYIPEGDPDPFEVINQFLADLEYDYVTSEVLTSSHYIIYSEEDGRGFYGHSKRIIVIKDHIIERLDGAGFNRMKWAKALLKGCESFEDLKGVIKSINEKSEEYGITFELYKNKEEAGIK